MIAYELWAQINTPVKPGLFRIKTVETIDMVAHETARLFRFSDSIDEVRAVRTEVDDDDPEVVRAPARMTPAESMAPENYLKGVRWYKRWLHYMGWWPLSRRSHGYKNQKWFKELREACISTGGICRGCDRFSYWITVDRQGLHIGHITSLKLGRHTVNNSKSNLSLLCVECDDIMSDKDYRGKIASLYESDDPFYGKHDYRGVRRPDELVVDWACVQLRRQRRSG